MSRDTDLTLPGVVPPALLASYEALSPERQAAVKAHLLGGTSSEWMANWLSRASKPVGATTIKRYRRWLEGSVTK